MARITAEQLIQQLQTTVQQLAEDQASIADLKIAAGALREMREGFKLFAPYRHIKKVSTFGSARVQEGDPVFRLAEEFARRIADHGFMVITGAGGGIMEACQRGAGRERSFGVNIRLPHEQQANSIISGDPKLMSFRYFFTRKLFFLKEADAVVLFPGGFGTHDEAFETLTLLQTGKTRPVPLVFLDRPGGTYWTTWRRYVEDHMLRRGMIDRTDFCLFRVTDNVDEAIHEILNFYTVYHSIRYVRELLAIRLQRPLPDAYVAELNEKFADIVVRGRMEQRGPLPAEQDEPDLASLPRLVLQFDRLHYGRLRELIDAINAAPQS
ncbi:MAG: Rossman fold protein, TIGR00730 family [Candidatus Binatia bacterium]|nr:MAG: Rossman fold protein, TIGR00730 family [Candidatus Binatia bacterium]